MENCFNNFNCLDLGRGDFWIMEEYYDAKDLKEMNFNMKLLIQKFNHEHTTLVEDIKQTNQKIIPMKKDLRFLKTEFTKFSSNINGMSVMLKLILGFISIVGTLIGIGVVLS